MLLVAVKSQFLNGNNQFIYPAVVARSVKASNSHSVEICTSALGGSNPVWGMFIWCCNGPAVSFLQTCVIWACKLKGCMFIEIKLISRAASSVGVIVPFQRSQHRGNPGVGRIGKKSFLHQFCIFYHFGIRMKPIFQIFEFNLNLHNFLFWHKSADILRWVHWAESRRPNK